MHKPAGEALIIISRKFFGLIDGTRLKTKLLNRHKYLCGKLDSPLAFIEHLSPPSNFDIDNERDAPALVAVFNPTEFTREKNGKYKGVPHHRVVSFVEATSKRQGGGRAQAASYAYRHLQARPDHPMVYCLVIKPQWYQVLLSSPSGIVASAQTSWDNLDLLLAYVYSHYDPRDDHFLDDDTLRWIAPAVPKAAPSWEITFQGKVYEGDVIFRGKPWGRRTTVFRATKSVGQFIFKEQYRHEKRRFKEEEVLEHIHADGDIPGVVRLKAWENVHTGGKLLHIGSGDGIRTKRRLAFYDDGEHLRNAKSVNDLLKAIYDVLEVHRTIYLRRHVLHRDMSLYNILIYPRWANVEGRNVSKDTPPFIKDVLDEFLRPLEDRTADCLMIDTDNAAILDTKNVDEDSDLLHRTGTPMYIARSVCLGRLQRNMLSLTGVAMPTLTDEAKRLYVKAYGQHRYDQFTDKNPDTFRGGKPPKRWPNPLPPFVHRPCHDAESIFWTMLAALLRVQPKSAALEPYAHPLVAELWATLYAHKIPDKPQFYRDNRNALLMTVDEDWVDYFFPEMRDVALLLFDISRHIAPEYELWTPKPPDDHLHEAMQRLILQYLVDHRDQPIPLDPDNLRPTGTEARPFEDKNKTEDTVMSTQDPDNGTCGTGSGPSAQKTSSSKAKRTRTSSSKSPVVRHTGERTSATSKSATLIVVDPKRKRASTTSPGGRRSKRIKAMSDSVIIEDCEKHED
ncbi:hypothetical protein L227DRAFT_592819 [Lentinus tigrinus ALCF2SS1-6]|uniref:Fungal-type protein kinase domain-containing protein n=2 Tax=Lentinus tigrinus TaxID=5365 RepID=A0A5C2SD48_9APHY|nr:hypothetical protein L227DRAFT_592819 [Lentinus tigrinus ALCF2SS1-6]